MNKIDVAVKTPNGELEFKQIENTLESFYKEIGCKTIEVVYPLGELEEQGIIIIGDEEAKLKGLDCNFWLYDKTDCFNGTAVFLFDNNEDFGALKEEHKPFIKKYLEDNFMNIFEKDAVLKLIKENF